METVLDILAFIIINWKWTTPLILFGLTISVEFIEDEVAGVIVYVAQYVGWIVYFIVMVTLLVRWAWYSL